ncbi:MAG: UDP-glucose 4-epimerase GalE [Acidobacteria bacterium]|nr:UDP-glucose 4-epimerase GalE [Acidobacteriota bacterium]
MNVLVTGGAGYIGSVVTEECIAAGHTAFVIDDLSKGHQWMVHPDAELTIANIADREVVGRLLTDKKIDAVIHMAASSLVGESMSDPAKYYSNNVVAGAALLDSMRDAGVNKIIFSSTAAVYGEPEKQPIEEGDKLQPTNPYGESKLAFEHILKWYSQAYDLRYVALRYFNAAGATERCGELHDPETHLIPLVLNAASGESAEIDVFGDDYSTRDGTCIRDYIHVADLAKAHVLALDKLEQGSATYNLGLSGGFSVKEVIEAAKRVTGKPIHTRVSARRAGDPAVLIASSDRIKKDLGWEPEFTSIEDIIQTAWNWKQANKDRTANAGN